MKSCWYIVALTALLGCQKLGDTLTASRPVIDHAYPARTAVVVGDTTHVVVEARDLNGEDIDYVWSATSGNGTLEGDLTGPVAVWRAPNAAGSYQVNIRVTNESSKSRSTTIDIQAVLNEIPIVSISNLQNGSYIASNSGPLSIQTQTTAVNGVDSVKCLINDAVLESVVGNSTSLSKSFTWPIANLSGNQVVTVRGWSHKEPSKEVIFGETSVQVSIEPIVGKTRRR